MNIKKLFALLAGVSLVAQTVVPSAGVFGATYSEELQGAYDWAYSNGVTTMSPIDNANMYGAITRAEMAKMLSVYAKDVLGKKADSSKACEFTDIDSVKGDLHDYIIESCQLGIMGQGITEFRPYSTITRAEFGTALSRVLYGDVNNGGNPYYAKHLSALKADGIMTQIDNPTERDEIRGYVMLMLQRSDEGGAGVDCDDATIGLVCLKEAAEGEYKDCPVACRDEEEDKGDDYEEEVKAGSLQVSLGDSLDDGTQIPQTGTVKLASVKFSSSETVSVRAVSLKKVGISSIPAGTKVWFEKDGIRISGKATFTSDGEATLSFAPVLSVKSSEVVDLYAEIAGGTVGATIQIESTDIESSAKDVDGKFRTPSLTFANYAVADVTFTAGGAGGKALTTDGGIELGEFKLENINPSRDVLFQSVTLKQVASADLENLADFVLERNGEVVSDDYTVDGKYVTFTVNDKISKDTSSVKYTIKAIANNVDTTGDAYQFSLNKETDISIIEEETDFRTSITSTGAFGVYTIEGGEMTFARDTSLELSATYPAGSEVTMLKGTIKTNEAVSLEDVTLTWLGDNNLETVFSTVYLKIGNSLLTYTPTTVAKNATIKFEGSTTVDGTAQVRLYGTMKNTATGTVKFSALQLGSFSTAEYVSNGNRVTSYVGNIQANTIDIANTTLNVTRTDGLGNTTLAAGSSKVTMYEMKLSSTAGNGVKITKAAFEVAAGASFANDTTLTLYVDGAAKSSKTYKGTSPVTFDGFNVTVDSKDSHTFKVVADFTENLTDGQTIQLTLTGLTATDTLTSNDVTSYSKPAGAVFTVRTASAEIASTDANPDATFILAGSSENKLIAFKVSAKNDSVRLYNLAFTGENLDKATNYELLDAEGNVIAVASSSDASTLKFSDMSGTPDIAKDKSAVYYVRATANTDTAGAIALTLTTGSNVKASNGTTVNVTGAAVNGKEHQIAENSILVAKLANSNKELSTSALRFSITANGKDSVIITGLDVTYNGNYTLTTGAKATKLRVYKNSISSTNLVASADADTASTFTGIALVEPIEIDAGSTVNYIVVVEGATNSAYSADWSVKLNDVRFSNVSAKDYSNLGELPISESK